MSGPTQAEIARFNSKWIKRGDCHIWTGYKDKDGYGQITFRRLPRRVHRVALFLAGKSIPLGFVITQNCGRRDCVNVQHLQMMPRAELEKRTRSVSSVNSRKTHCPKGHPYNRVYGKHRYCSICESEKTKRLRAKWRAEGILKI